MIVTDEHEGPAGLRERIRQLSVRVGELTAALGLANRTLRENGFERYAPDPVCHEAVGELLRKTGGRLGQEVAAKCGLNPMPHPHAIFAGVLDADGYPLDPVATLPPEADPVAIMVLADEGCPHTEVRNGGD